MLLLQTVEHVVWVQDPAKETLPFPLSPCQSLDRNIAPPPGPRPACLHVLIAPVQTVEHVVWVQVPDEEEGEESLPGLPPRAPSPSMQRRAGAAIAINASAARRSQYHYAAREEGEEEGELYSRSLAFVPPSPALPAPFR